MINHKKIEYAEDAIKDYFLGEAYSNEIWDALNELKKDYKNKQLLYKVDIIEKIKDHIIDIMNCKYKTKHVPQLVLNVLFDKLKNKDNEEIEELKTLIYRFGL